MTPTPDLPAFPVNHFDLADHYKANEDAITTRDYFAARAMQSIVAGAIAQGAATEPEDAPELARAAWLMADAMLKTREVKP